MTAIGMNFAATSFPEPNIEDTLLFASIEGMEKDDLRVLAVLVTWFEVHAPWVNADRLTKLMVAQKSPRLRALWAALARGKGKDRRFARLAASYVGLRQDLIEAGTEFQVARRVEDPRFEVFLLR
jgi:hypothetical protein